MKAINISYLFSLCFLLSTTSGCITKTIKPNDPYFAPANPKVESKLTPRNGSLFLPNQSIFLFENSSDHRVGDIIEVTLDEKTVSTKSSGIAIDKAADVSLLENSNKTFLGKDMTKKLPFIGNTTLPLSTSQNRAFSGDASADQSNSLQGSISVTVTEILSNGNLMVRGEKWMTLNRGDEYIRISGVLRKDDISLENTVSSTKLANARISYSGTGDLANSQKIGWLGQFFNSILWPF